MTLSQFKANVHFAINQKKNQVESEEEKRMDVNWKKKLLAGGMMAILIFGGLAGCADGKDQDNGIDDGEQEDQLDTDNDANEEIEQENEDQNDQLDDQTEEDSEMNDGVDQDNGIDDGDVDDQIDPENNPEE
jgi:antitoxin component YwqK of YwqJK toxin-antitoxin module